MLNKTEQAEKVLRRWIGVKKLLECLSAREQDVLVSWCLREGLAEMAKRLKITKERVRQIQTHAISKFADLLFDEFPPKT